MSNDAPSSPPPPLIVDTKRHECGCVETHFADGRVGLNPCPPCGFAELGGLLTQAGTLLVAISRRLAAGATQPLRRV